MPCLAEIIESSEGQRPYVTIDEARAIAQIRGLAPDIDLWSVFYYGRLVVFAGSDPDVLRRLDAVLAFAPWRGDKERARLVKAEKVGWLPGPKWKDVYGALVLSSLKMFVDKAHVSQRALELDAHHAYTRQLTSTRSASKRFRPRTAGRIVTWSTTIASTAR